MFCYLIPAIIPISILYYNYQIYKKLEVIYQKTTNLEKKINYYLNYQYIEPIKEVNSYSNKILESQQDNNFYNSDENENKIYLVL